MNNTTLRVLKLLLFLGAFSAILFFARRNDPSGVSNTSYSMPSQNPNAVSINAPQEEKQWSEAIEKLGPYKAWEQFKSYTKKESSYAKQHFLAHIFGYVLYQKMGAQGILVCDSSFQSGCYHSISAIAIATKGIAAAKTLADACDKSPQVVNCKHGIGHGLVEYFGPDKLLSSLQICKSIEPQLFINGCAQGVFMEYDTPIKIDNSTISFPLKKLGDTPYGPCATVSVEFRESCYHELPDWWSQLLHNDFKKIGSLCNNIDDSKEKETCFSGAGVIAAQSANFDLKQTRTFCNAIESIDGQSLCKGSASRVLANIPWQKSVASQVCSDLSAKERKEKCVP